MPRLSDILIAQVDAQRVANARTYERIGCVSIATQEDDYVEAAVQGSSRYAVILFLNSGVLQVTCSCPDFEGSNHVCKHVLATALRVERDGGFLRVPRSLIVQCVPTTSAAADGFAGDQHHEFDDDDDDDPEFDDDDDDDDDDDFDDLDEEGRIVVLDDGPDVVRGVYLRQSAAPPTSQGNPTDSIRSGPPTAIPSTPPVLWREVIRQVKAAADAPAPARPRRKTIHCLVGTRDTRVGKRLTVTVSRGVWRRNKLVLDNSGYMSTHEWNMSTADRAFLSALRHAQSPAGDSRYALSYETLRYGEPVALHGAGARAILATLPADRAWWADAPGQQAFRYDATPARLLVRFVEADDQVRVRGALRRGREVDGTEISACSFLADDGHVVVADTAFQLDDPGLLPLAAQLHGGDLVVQPDEAREFIAQLLELGERLDIDAPASLMPKLVRGEPQPLLIVKQRPNQALEARAAFRYQDERLMADDPTPRIILPGRGQILERDAERERVALAALHAALAIEAAADGSFQIPPGDLPAIVRRLHPLGWQVLADDKVVRPSSTIHIEITSGQDWFELSGGTQYDGIDAPLPALLRALRDRRTLVELTDGSVGLLPEEWLRRNGLLLELGRAEGDKLRFQRGQALWIDALSQAEGVVIEADADFQRTRTALRKAGSPTRKAAPRGFRGELRPYQADGLGWLDYLRKIGIGGCLADDMGLGKTIQVLAHLLATKRGRTAPVLAVVPKSLVFNWIDEARRFAPSLRVAAYVGGERRTLLADPQASDLWVTTYGVLRLDVETLRAIKFDTVILDEAQAIKNHATATATAACSLDTQHRLALSGTPIENHLGELGSLLEFLNPGLMGRNPLLRMTGAQRVHPEAVEMLAKSLRPLILRRTKTQVARDLPERTEQTIFCELEPAQRRCYDELRLWYRNELLKKAGERGLARMKIQVLEALLRLRQVACHPALIDPRHASAGSAKLDVLMPRLLEVVEEGNKALVFSQFTSFLALVRQQLDAQGIRYEYLDGATNDRAERVARFQADESIKLFLISLKAGGVGLNLTAAQYVFLLDPWWNPAAEAQAIDRTHRIGQTRSVFAFRLIAKGTVEEKIAAMQEQKRGLADAILSADNAILRALTADDLNDLLS